VLQRHKGQLRSALRSFQRALDFEERLPHAGIREEAEAGAAVSGSTVTHLNTCAVLSALGRHNEALWHAQQAVRQLAAAQAAGQEAAAREARQLLCTAYHNLGCEAEHLALANEALEAFALAAVAAADAFGRSSSQHALAQETLQRYQRKVDTLLRRLASSSRAAPVAGRGGRRGAAGGTARAADGPSSGAQLLGSCRAGAQVVHVPPPPPTQLLPPFLGAAGATTPGAGSAPAPAGALAPSQRLLTVQGSGWSGCVKMASDSRTGRPGGPGTTGRVGAPCLPTGCVVWADEEDSTPLWVEMQARAQRVAQQLKIVGEEAYARSA
jgi:hypothetical protein